MKVIVQLMPTHVDEEAKSETFENADGWHIDEERQLHVKRSGSGSGNLAAYATGAWRGIREVTDN